MNDARRGQPMVVDAWGIAQEYEDSMQQWQTTPVATQAAIRLAMGVDPHVEEPGPPTQESVRVLRRGDSFSPGEGSELTLEDGTVLKLRNELPQDLPYGYHELRRAGSNQPMRLILTPGRCVAPAKRTAGWAVQLYALRSQASWGMGDLADLRRLGLWSANQGAPLLLINPINAVAPLLPQEASPYSPSSRCFQNPLYLRIEDIPGAELAGADLERLAISGRALNSARQIDRDNVFRLKTAALENIWNHFHESLAFDQAGFAAYCRAGGALLDNFARFSALLEQYGRDWRTWEPQFQHPGTPEVANFASDFARRVQFYKWQQWLLDGQLARAAADVCLMRDLPIGVDPGGADAWTWQDVFAKGVNVGAPPDLYSSQGQNWGLPPFVPHRLQAAGYEPFIQTLRASLRNAGGLRIDHVMGLFRLFWIPEGFPSKAGTFVRYPAADLLGILALESERAGAVIVGEDLGTVETGVRENLHQHSILSYRVFWFEGEPTSGYPSLSLATVSTHDLPTIAGIWSGFDFREQQAIHLNPNAAAFDGLRAHLQAGAGVAADAPVEHVIERMHHTLAKAPSLFLTATLDDAVAVEERPNIPNTTSERPNWSIALPKTLEEIEQAPLAAAIIKTLAQGVNH